jgi:hypothetical protein
MAHSSWDTLYIKNYVPQWLQPWSKRNVFQNGNWKPKLYVKFQQKKTKNKTYQNAWGEYANCFVMFLVQENPFQRAARRQQRSGSLSSSSTAGDSSESTCSNAASPSDSQEQHTAVDMRGMYSFLFKLILCHWGRYPLIYDTIKSSSSLSCDRPKLSSPKSAILSSLLQLPVSSCFLQVIQQLLTSPSSPSCTTNLFFNVVTCMPFIICCYSSMKKRQEF